ncbi:MAG: hypothetical protein AB1461_07490 [Thermodesulfobacteriota bacterium]
MTHNKKGTMVLAPTLIALLIGISIFSSIAVAASPTPKQLEDALTEVKSEPKAISVAWNDTSIPSLLVGVADDKTQRDGYAQYICLVLAEHGIRGGVVRIMDEYAARKNEWKELGKSWCPK